MRFADEREVKETILNKMIEKFDQLFIKENISTPRSKAIEQTIEEVFNQLRTRDMLKWMKINQKPREEEEPQSEEIESPASINPVTICTVKEYLEI